MESYTPLTPEELVESNAQRMLQPALLGVLSLVLNPSPDTPDLLLAKAILDATADDASLEEALMKDKTDGETPGERKLFLQTLRQNSRSARAWAEKVLKAEK